MQSWAMPTTVSKHAPTPAPGPVLVRDHSSGQLVDLAAPEAGMYVCGITPYDATHMGHAATYLAFDLLGRVLRDAGTTVKYCQNVTDVDDPLLERAAATGVDWRALAERETELFRRDMEYLAVIPPDWYVGVTEAIDEVVGLIETLRTHGAVYELDGDLYFPVSAAAHFGQVSGFDREQMAAVFAERGGDPDRPGKKDPFDLLLWRQERPGEPAWDTPLGRGRPGWHIECAAIAANRLGASYAIQGGGNDLIFPHHEGSSAHLEAATGIFPTAKVYAYSGMIWYDGAKMSKSLGNLVLISTLREAGVPAAAIRLALASSPFRADLEWTDQLLGAASRQLCRWQAAVARPAAAPAAPVIAAMRNALRADLDSPAALAAVDVWAGQDGDDEDAPVQIAGACEQLLGIRLS